MAEVGREFLAEFIQLYRSLPCLWHVKCKDYSDRNKKDLAYMELVKKYKEVDPAADRNLVVKKISSLRTVYKKELGKVNSSLKSGAGADEVQYIQAEIVVFRATSVFRRPRFDEERKKYA